MTECHPQWRPERLQGHRSSDCERTPPHSRGARKSSRPGTASAWPTASSRPGRRNCHRFRAPRHPAGPPRSSITPPPKAWRAVFPNAHRPHSNDPAAATRRGPVSGSRSKEDVPCAQNHAEPCSPAVSGAAIPARPCHPPSRRRAGPDRRQAARGRAATPITGPRIGSHPDARSARTRPRPVRSGALATSPAGRYALGIEDCRPIAIGPDRPCGRAIRRLETGSR